jgi:hypothetical protein
MTPEKLALLNELVAAAGGDAVFRPSSADRLLGCPGSIVLSARVPRGEEKSSGFAAEGTAAHAVVEDALRGVRSPEEWADQFIEPRPGIRQLVDEEMVEVANEYVEIVESFEGPGTKRLVEHRLSLAPLDPSDPLFGQNRGTADTVVVDPIRRKLTIVDLKYGKGVIVARDTPQLKDYALMALVTFAVPEGWDTVEIKVVQPRTPHWEEARNEPPVTFTPDYLYNEFLPQLVGAMEEALDPKARLVPNPKWCRWCPAAGPDERGQPICPALADRAMHIARDAFASAPLFNASSIAVLPPKEIMIDAKPPAGMPPGSVVVLPSPLSLDPADIATILDRREFYETFITGVEKRAAALLMAGVNVPGYAMKPRSGHRRFKDPEKAPDALRAMGLQTSALYTDPKLKSPAQIEKLLPADKKKLLETLVEKPEGEPTLVRASSTGSSVPIGLGPISATALPPN